MVLTDIDALCSREGGVRSSRRLYSSTPGTESSRRSRRHVEDRDIGRREDGRRQVDGHARPRGPRTDRRRHADAAVSLRQWSPRGGVLCELKRPALFDRALGALSLR